MSRPRRAAPEPYAPSRCPSGPPMLGTGNQAGCPGTRSAGSEAANTDRRAHRRQEATLRSGPRARLINGLASHRYAGVTGSPRPSSQPRPHGAARSARPAGSRHLPASPAPRCSRGARPGPAPGPGAAPRSGSDARQPASRSPTPNSQGSATVGPGEEANKTASDLAHLADHRAACVTSHAGLITAPGGLVAWRLGQA
jgi:hypothetical protein